MPSHHEPAPTLVPDGTPLVLRRLVESPTANVRCIFAEGTGAMAIWYMYAGCVALHEGSDFLDNTGISNFRVQPLCYHHTMRQEPLDGRPSDSSPQGSNIKLMQGSHLLVDLTLGANNRFPETTWAESGPHWSDTAGEGGSRLPPALELGYTMNDLRAFASTNLGRLVFAGFAQLLE